MELLSKPEYQHVLLNHIPLIGLAVGAVALAGALLLGGRRATLFMLFLVAALAGSVWPVMETGEAAQDRVQSMVYREGEAWLHHHEELVEEWVWVYFTTASVAFIGALAAVFCPRLLQPVVVLVLVLSAASLFAGYVIAEAGGRIRHDEFRTQPPPNLDSHPDHEE